MKLFFVLSILLLLLAVTIYADEPFSSRRSSAIAIVEDGNNNDDSGGGDDPQRRLVEEYLSKNRDWKPRRDKGELPIGLTAQEKVLQRDNIFLQQQKNTTDNRFPLRNFEVDKPTNPRFLEEWSEMEGVLIRYPLGISTSLVKAMSERAKIFCLVNSNKDRRKASRTFDSAGIQASDIEWIIARTDSYWTRDYGPWFVATPSSSKGIAVVDHKYNRPRPNDDKVPLKIAEALGVPYYDSNVVGTGGNMMTDGKGQAAAAHIAYTENADCYTNDDSSVPLEGCNSVDTKMKDYFGIGVFRVVADPSGTYIDHVDCWAKYLSSDTILIREVSKDHPRYDDIETVARYFASTTTSEGQAWRVVRVWTDYDQPYTNSLILNGEVFVPIVGSKDDEAALEVYRNAMPDYKVSGWTGSWDSTDALHCRTKGIPKTRYVPPSDAPMTGTPTATPTISPTEAPTATPTISPTEKPTATPTKACIDEVIKIKGKADGCKNWLGKANDKNKRKRCKKKRIDDNRVWKQKAKQGTSIHKICRQTCGKVGIGDCKDMPAEIGSIII